MPSVNIRDLNSMIYLNGTTWWAYKAGDHTRTDVLAPGYWRDMAPRHGLDIGSLTVGDWIFAAGPTWAAILYVILADPDGVVVIETGPER